MHVCTNARGFLEPELGIGVARGHDVVCCNKHLFNCPCPYDIISKSVNKV